MQNDNSPDLDHTLMSLSVILGQVARRYKAAADKMAGDFQLSHASAWPVVMIGRLGDGVRPGAVADAVGLEAPSLVRIIDQLVEAGLVERRDDASDRRARTLHLTRSGRGCADQLEAALIPFRRELFADIAPAELHTCLRVLGKLDGAITAYDEARRSLKAP